MIIGVPRERKTLEKRIALTPDGAEKLINHGHEVLIEKDAGIGSLFEDSDFAKVGCKIVPTLKDVWKNADMVVKVKEPDESEFQYFRPGLILFDYLHLASMNRETKALMDGKVSGVAYELVETDDGRFPLLEPMSEVAGHLSVLLGAYYLLAQNGGRGILLAGTLGVPRRHVTIVGAGIAGQAACEAALGMGAEVTIFDIDFKKLERIKYHFQSKARTAFSTRANIERECAKTDLLVGAVLVPGASAPRVISREMIKAMRKGSVFVDISIDQGGCAETSRATSLESPIYIEDGVIHYCVPNMPAQTPRTSTLALTSATLPYITKLADLGFKDAINTVAPLRRAVNTHQGMLTNRAVAESLSLKYTRLEDALE